MSAPDLRLLQQGDTAAWDAAFSWLWPVVFAVAQGTLQPYLPADVEDAAIEALEDLIEHLPRVQSTEELKPLAASIAHRRSVSRLREHFAQKRGAGHIESLEARIQEAGDCSEPALDRSPLEAIGLIEMADLIEEMQRSIKPEHRLVISDFFLGGLSYQEIASRRGVAIGSVGVYLKRGLEALRAVASRQPELLKELEAFLR